jgi:hypothetical protein
VIDDGSDVCDVAFVAYRYEAADSPMFATGPIPVVPEPRAIVGGVAALNTIATQYMLPAVTAVDGIVTVIRPVVSIAASTPAEASRTPELLYRPTKFWPAVGVVAATAMCRYSLVTFAERAGYTAAR